MQKNYRDGLEFVFFLSQILWNKLDISYLILWKQRTQCYNVVMKQKLMCFIKSELYFENCGFRSIGIDTVFWCP